MYSLRRSCHVITSNKHASHILMAQFCSVVQLLALVYLVHEQSPPVFHFSLRVFWWSQLEHYQSLASSGTEVQSINSDTSILPGYILQYNIHSLDLMKYQMLWSERYIIHYCHCCIPFYSSTVINRCSHAVSSWGEVRWSCDAGYDRVWVFCWNWWSG